MNVDRSTIIDNYFKIWAVVLPITSFLVIPFIQGTTPAYIFALLSILIIPVLTKFKGKGSDYIRDLLFFLYIYICINLIGQLYLSFDIKFHPDFSTVRIIDDDDISTTVFRKSMFTQSLYLLAAVATFVFVKNFYKPNWDNFIFLGACILGIYGIYEVTYFLLFHENGDFISNRTFGDGTHSGSLFQTITIGSLVLQRLKSLTGEPSMYAFTILPFWIYAIHKKKTLIHLFLFITLMLTTSTTAYIGMIMYTLIRIRYFGVKDKIVLFLIVIGLIVCLLNWDFISMFVNATILEKLSLSNDSGIERFMLFTNHMDFYKNLPLFTQIFGMGFGVVRSTDMFSTLLVNNGVVGFVLFTLLFFYPVFKLENTYQNIGLKAALIVIYFSMMISVPEYSYLSTWLFLGMAYNMIPKRNIAYNTNHTKSNLKITK